MSSLVSTVQYLKALDFTKAKVLSSKCPRGGGGTAQALMN